MKNEERGTKNEWGKRLRAAGGGGRKNEDGRTKTKSGKRSADCGQSPAPRLDRAGAAARLL